MITKYKNVKIESTPLPKFQDMVQIVLTPTVLKGIKGKKFVTLDKAKIAIDKCQAESIIRKMGSKC